MEQNSSVERRRIRQKIRNVTRNFKAHVPFFIALFLIQTLFSILFLSAGTDLHTASRLISDRYDYDISFQSLAQSQYAALYNLCGTDPGEDRPWLTYENIRYEENGDGSYNAFISLRGSSAEEAAGSFLGKYLPELEKIDSVTCIYSPRYRYQTDYASSVRVFLILSTLLVTALSVFLLIELYRMRLNHETYDFGVYLTCGATFRTLFHVAASELLTIGALTFLPALLVGTGISALLFSACGSALYLSPVALLLIPVFSLGTELLSLWLPMRSLASRPPIRLLTARDNSSLVTSPRASFRVFGKKFPTHYELISLWRYRKYLAWILFSTVIFPVLFICTSSFADYRETRTAAPTPDFTVTFQPKIVNPETLTQSTADLSAEMETVDGVAYCLPDVIRVSASALHHVVLLTDEQDESRSGTVANRARTNSEVDPRFTRATNLYDLTALDESAVHAMTMRYQEIEGDPSCVLTDDHTVILSEAVNNVSHFHFKVGDTVMLCTEAHGAVAVISSDELFLLKTGMEEVTYVFEPYTVGAVIHDEASGSHLTVGMNFSAYETLTGEVPLRKSIDVYLSDLADFDAWQTAAAGVYSAANGYYNCIVEDHSVFFNRCLDSLKNMRGRILSLAVSFLIMMPLICFFSQRVFYGKRKPEWEMLRALGAPEQDIRHAFLFSGAVTAALTFLLTLPLGLLFDRLLFRLQNEWLPAGAFISSVHLTYETPWGKILLMMLFSLLCGLLPPVTSYLRRRRENRLGTGSLMQGE